MDLETFESLKSYVGLDESAMRELRALHAVATPCFPAIVDDFYAAIQAHPRARSVITGGSRQIERLKKTLIGWLGSVLLGPYDQAYLDAHARIGRVHVRIALPQEFMFTAMNRIRVRLLDVVRDHYQQEPAKLAVVATAVHQILDLELTLMLGTFREDLVEKVRSTERLATIGQLAASIGHELRNPLGVIESSMFLLDRRMHKLGIDDEQLTRHQKKIVEQFKHCGKIIDGLLDLARDKPPTRQRVEVAPLVERAMEYANAAGRLVLDVELPEGLTIDADPDDMMLVLANLLINALEAQQGTGRARISACATPGGVELRVHDSGPGVPPEIRSQIFDALFTTKARGTGLGLALCRRIVYAHGGELQLEDAPGGACFRLWLPEVVDGQEGTPC